ncbi:hypothetical protein [Ensifer sp. ZNC0028]|uniref:hypothetical protein n=1 Tax=Ensifer sp. ZNC0028 TaxID=1339236 RepID=UPI000AA51DA9|nr:hypothetical protein [Ensifer sp. ZNC0028]
MKSQDAKERKPMTTQRIEIVTYKISNPAVADQQRDIARNRAAALPGFGGWLPLSGEKDQAERADLIAWDSAEAAQSAGKIVGSSPDFAQFRETINEFGKAQYYAAPGDGIALMTSGDGIEFGRFRLRAGVSEDTMRTAHAAMIANHLSLQPGWLGQKLVRLQDGTFVDVAFAVSEERSIAICSSWAGNASCDAFLGLIEPISMEFGSIT